jgi:hypothetical protein
MAYNEFSGLPENSGPQAHPRYKRRQATAKRRLLGRLARQAQLAVNVSFKNKPRYQPL